MKCIYRKEISYKIKRADYDVYTTKDRAHIITEGFADCYGKDCRLYSEGKCARVLKEFITPLTNT